MYFICSKHPIKVKLFSLLLHLSALQILMNWFTFYRAYQICIKNNKKSCLLQWTLISMQKKGLPHFLCRLAVIYNPKNSLINFDQQQVQLLDSCSVFENKIFPLIGDHLVVGELGIFRQLLFSMVMFLLWWTGPRTVTFYGNLDSVPYSNCFCPTFFWIHGTKADLTISLPV